MTILTSILKSDDVDTIAGYYLTGVGNIPDQDSRETFWSGYERKNTLLWQMIKLKMDVLQNWKLFFLI